ncbi:DUF4135 domain-containing protein [Ferrimonas aestuarii]|uniref:DUF4135 domain-containing protein n=1 Tax=Ferrimonas aestuarii TaxID=2569539 RepID=A0A4U1BKP4_9GAMM|nr:DUF4135 domain-containing protein [Ferrimonas aestuarii]
MDYQKLVKELKSLNVNVSDKARNYRASLYLKNLKDTQTYLTKTLAQSNSGIGSSAFKFCKTALQFGGLIQQLADVLDHYSCPALQGNLSPYLKEGNKKTYYDYFDDNIFDANDTVFDTNVTKFWNLTPLSSHAITQLVDNFQRNIKTACQRVYQDITKLEACFEGQYDDNFSLNSLKRIKSTGSDFHKGGQQVLILTFGASDEIDSSPAPLISSFNVQVVYKPGDIEADCLISGNSQVVNKVLGKTFMTNSLFEIYNQQLTELKQQQPSFAGLPLATYRILPIAYQSDNKTPLRQAYGYLEYLDNDVSGTFAQIFGFYPFASSDYLIFKSESKEQIVSSFYRQAGAMSAVASSFSIIDLHIENVRVETRKPYFIDMEVCLTSPVDDIELTSLLKDKQGGINGISLNYQDLTYSFKNLLKPDEAEITTEYPDVYYQNRLWQVSPKNQKQPIPVNAKVYQSGVADGFKVLEAAQSSGKFTHWFQRLNNVVVRYLPCSTTDFKAIATTAFLQDPEDQRKKNQPVNNAIDDALLNKLTNNFNKYKEAGNTLAPPEFLSLTPSVSQADYRSLDIPVFYHRIGSTDLLDSLGQVVAIPANVTVYIGNTPTVVAVNSVFTGTTFFQSSPMATKVQQAQVEILSNASKAAAREQLLTQSISSFFSADTSKTSETFRPIKA